MVAYTPELCLPYYEGTDSPCLHTGTVCDPSNVWCDLVNLVDPILTANDDLIARTSTAVPLAQVRYVAPSPTVAVLGPIPFNTVDLDTDDMVDLDLYAGIVPRRNGVYQIDAVALYESAANDALVTSYIIVDAVAQFVGLSTLFPGAIGILHTRGATTPNPIAPMIRSSVIWAFSDTAPSPRNITVNSQYNASPLVSAVLTVSWHSDVA